MATQYDAPGVSVSVSKTGVFGATPEVEITTEPWTKDGASKSAEFIIWTDEYLMIYPPESGLVVPSSSEGADHARRISPSDEPTSAVRLEIADGGNVSGISANVILSKYAVQEAPTETPVVLILRCMVAVVTPEGIVVLYSRYCHDAELVVVLGASLVGHVAVAVIVEEGALKINPTSEVVPSFLNTQPLNL